MSKSAARLKTGAVTEQPLVPWRERALLNMNVASEIAGLSPTTLYRFAAEDRLVLKRLGGRTMIETASFIALVDNAEEWTPSNKGAAARAARAPRAAQARA